ncbi:hypothetical protein CROQUDRAFT_201493 [Cronartium quercuum f. sp. fusiforme G11]|uniref:Transmembrane protein n=1 Tax=Cronartium quercuum f. sp. fusiforme G11 TaxID=708437 RepID=A0A9P6NGD2_9BASI|nr:hypothetical protein CROQUDRAFT_201493 [Cronartium quercuum f. sp. fusiforme G11]
MVRRMVVYYAHFCDPSGLLEYCQSQSKSPLSLSLSLSLSLLFSSLLFSSLLFSFTLVGSVRSEVMNDQRLSGPSRVPWISHILVITRPIRKITFQLNLRYINFRKRAKRPWCRDIGMLGF